MASLIGLASGRPGADTAFDTNHECGTAGGWSIKLLKRLEVRAGVSRPQGRHGAVDRALLRKLAALVTRRRAKSERRTYARILQRTEEFFWSVFATTIYELFKGRRIRSNRPRRRASRQHRRWRRHFQCC
jgi:valyl-tRNA synthetase